MGGFFFDEVKILFYIGLWIDLDGDDADGMLLAKNCSGIIEYDVENFCQMLQLPDSPGVS